MHTTDEWGRLQLAAASHADESMLPRLHTVLEETGPDSMLGPAAGGVAQRLAGAARAAAGGLRASRWSPAGSGSARSPSAATSGTGTTRTRSPCWRTWPAGRRWRSRTRASTPSGGKVAHTLQQSLLPPVLPVVKGIGFAAEYVPTGDAAEVGGDFYDVVPLADDRWLVVVGDVSGKGVQAAAVTGLVRDVIRVLVRDGRPLPEALARLNDTLVERGGGRYCTLALAAVGPGTSGEGDLAVSLHLAGHDRPVLVRADGRGVLRGYGRHRARACSTRSPRRSPDITLRPGDALVFYTDGVTERRRGRELFGPERLCDAAAPLAGYSADVVAARLRTAVHRLLARGAPRRHRDPRAAQRLFTWVTRLASFAGARMTP